MKANKKTLFLIFITIDNKNNRVATVREKSRKKRIFSRPVKSQGILYQLREILHLGQSFLVGKGTYSVVSQNVYEGIDFCCFVGSFTAKGCVMDFVSEKSGILFYPDELGNPEYSFVS